MRKIIVLICIGACCIALSSCNYDLYYGKRPFDYGAAKWICEEPSAWFVVDPNSEEYYRPKGEIQLNNETMQFELFFIVETNFVAFQIIMDSSLNDEPLELKGECEFSPQNLTVKVDQETDTIFNGQYDILIFTRTSTE